MLSTRNGTNHPIPRLVTLAKLHKPDFLPCVAIKFAAFVHAKNQIDVLAGPECLVENALIVPLGRPKSFLDAQI